MLLVGLAALKRGCPQRAVVLEQLGVVLMKRGASLAGLPGTLAGLAAVLPFINHHDPATSAAPCTGRAGCGAAKQRLAREPVYARGSKGTSPPPAP
jgi:hypothetical protein